MTDKATGVPVQKPRQVRMSGMDAIQLQKMYGNAQYPFCMDPLVVGYCQVNSTLKYIYTFVDDFHVQVNQNQLHFPDTYLIYKQIRKKVNVPKYPSPPKILPKNPPPPPPKKKEKILYSIGFYLFTPIKPTFFSK